jgi:hypothetical protein
MTLLYGVTEEGAEAPVLVDDQGRLVAVPAPGTNLVPGGGTVGQQLTRVADLEEPIQWKDPADPAKSLPGFFLRGNAIYTVPSGAPGLRIPLGPNPNLLRGAEFDPVTSRITPKIAGWWMITAKLRCSVVASDIRSKYVINGGPTAQMERRNSDGLLPVNVEITHPYNFNGVSDYFEMWVEHYQGADVVIDKPVVIGHYMCPA